MSDLILTVNAGSSSVRCAVFAAERPEERLLSAHAERIGTGDAKWTLQSGDGAVLEEAPLAMSDHRGAIAHLLGEAERRVSFEALIGVGHRLVHGGVRYDRTMCVAPDTIAELRALEPLAPNHLPQEIDLLEALLAPFPDVPHVACFDTSFHRDLPLRARLLPIPRHYADRGIRRFGFHGLSYTWLLERLVRDFGADAAAGRVILAHLGAGCSMAAVRSGRCIDTTMAFTPLAGMMMGTRSGDLDPGLLIHLMRVEQLGPDELEELLSRRSGLLGLSETSGDVRDLLSREATDERAATALEAFCYHARKWIGALAAALGGLDRLVFSGGIGENAAPIRSRICEGLQFVGVTLDEGRNRQNAATISATGSRVTVHVIPTDEEALIAAETLRMVRPSG